MARTKIRERQVLDSDFASEVELEERFTLHNSESIHLPEGIQGTNDNQFLKFDGKDYVWTDITTLDIVANPFYYDKVRDKYLGNEEKEIQFYLSGTRKSRQYMYQVPNVRSNKSPYRVKDEYCITGYSFYNDKTVTDNDVIDLRDDNKNSILSISVINSDSSSDDTVDILINDINLSSYINYTKLDIPVLKIYLRKTYYPEGA